MEKWQEITVTTKQDGVETVADAFMEAGAGGVAVHDPQLIARYKEAGVWDYDNFSDELLKQEDIRVVGYFPLNDKIGDRLAFLKERLVNTGVFFEISLAEVAEEDWATAWKDYYKTEKVSEKLVIKPTWESYNPDPGEIILELDPGMAFGTGTHPTTVMCLRALEKYLNPDDFVIDLGTGSGVLAVAAAKLGAAGVLAIDLDETAVKVAAENLLVNGVAGKVRVVQGNLLDIYTENEKDILGKKEIPRIVVANIIASIIVKLVPDVCGILEPGGLFITSGIIQERLPDVEAALAESQFIIREIYREGEWAAIVAARE